MSGDVHSKYKKLSQREHILMRPEMYIGAVVAEDVKVWAELAGGQIKRVDVKFSQGMMKVVDEILVNASDNILEHADSKHGGVSYVSLEADTSTGVIAIENDGPGIPVVQHKEHGLWIPEMVFGHLLTGKNFHEDDNAALMAAGRHGYGAKLTNIFSKAFSVTTVCDGSKYHQNWSDNMGVAGKPVVTKVSKSEGDRTRVEFTPDYEKVGMPGLTSKFVSVLRKRFADLAVCHPDVRFSVNGKTLTSDFGKYIDLHGPDMRAVTTMKQHGRMQTVGVAFFNSPGSSLRGSNVSMINGVVTYNGGTHLEHAQKLLEKAATEAAASFDVQSSRELNMTKLASHCILFTSVYAPQPKFDSQSKVRLVSTHTWPKYEITPLTDTMRKVLQEHETKFFTSVFKKAPAKKVSGASVRNKVTKVHDAVYAGQPDRSCTLLVTEGDSASALAVGSLSVEQRKSFGVYPVRGKVLNVLTDVRRVSENKEWLELFTVMGLSPKDRNPQLDALRYQRIVFMTDQDHDGTHIRGLLLSGLHHLWPSLAREPGFASVFVTPMVKAFPKGKDELWFESSRDFEKWRVDSGDGLAFTKPARYYKGLGTSTTAEGKAYFARLPDLIRPFTFDPKGEEKLVTSFSPTMAAERRSWLAEGRIESGDGETVVAAAPTAVVDMAERFSFDVPTKSISVDGFVDGDLRQFALYDNSRMVPNMIDGLKTSSRKILDAAMQYQKQAMRVSQLAGLVSQKMSYHHGEASLVGVIIGFAQDYPGANNFPLLTAEGQFGSRLVSGGKDHAAPRYIFTQLRKHAWSLYPKADLHLLDRVTDDGEVVEPVTYAPVVPAVLLNGSMGITVGHKVDIHARHPLDVIAATRAVLRAKGDADTAVKDLRMRRHVTGTLGSILETNEGKGMISFGAMVISKQSDSAVKLRIVDLPVGVSAEKYRSQLATMHSNGDVKDYFEYSTTDAMDFDVTVSAEKFAKWECPYEGLKLARSFSENVVVFDDDGRLVEGCTIPKIFAGHYRVRHALYERRLDKLRAEKLRETQVAVGTFMFVALLNKKTITVETLTDEAALIEALKANKVPAVDDGYSYLTRLSVSRLFKTELEAAEKHARKLRDELSVLQALTAEELWTKELDELERVVTAYEKERCAAVVDKLQSRATFAVTSIVMPRAISGVDVLAGILPGGGDGGGDAPAPKSSGGGRGRGGRGRGRGGGKRAASLFPLEPASTASTWWPLAVTTTSMPAVPVSSTMATVAMPASAWACSPSSPTATVGVVVGPSASTCLRRSFVRLAARSLL